MLLVAGFFFFNLTLKNVRNPLKLSLLYGFLTCGEVCEKLTAAFLALLVSLKICQLDLAWNGYSIWTEGFPHGMVVKNPPADACDTGDRGLIAGLGRSCGGGNGNLLQYSCLENSTDRGPWRASVQGVTNSQTLLSNWVSRHTHIYTHVWIGVLLVLFKFSPYLLDYILI